MAAELCPTNYRETAITMTPAEKGRFEVYVDGKKVFDRSDPKDHLFAVGGFGASKDQEMHLDCYKDGD